MLHTRLLFEKVPGCARKVCKCKERLTFLWTRIPISDNDQKSIERESNKMKKKYKDCYNHHTLTRQQPTYNNDVRKK